MAYDGTLASLQTTAMNMARRNLTSTTDLARCTELLNEAYLTTIEETWQDGSGAYNYYAWAQTQPSFSTVANTNTYTLAGIQGGLVDVFFIGNAGGSQLNYLEPDDFYAQVDQGQAPAGAPLVWTKIARTSVVLYPTPSVVLTLNVVGIGSGTPMVNSTDTTVVPLSYSHRVLCHYAAARLLEEYGGFSTLESEFQWNMYQRAIAQLRESYGIAVPVNPRPAEFTQAPLTLGSLRDLAAKGIWRAGLDPWDLWALNRARDLVNECLDQVYAQDDPWTFLMAEGQITVPAGTDKISVASIATALGVAECGEVLALVDDNTGDDFGPLERVAWIDLERLLASTQDGEPPGHPVWWAKIGITDIRIAPRPLAQMTFGVLIREVPARLVNDTDVPSALPPVWRERLVIPYVAACLLRERALRTQSGTDVGLANQQWQLYEDAFQALRASVGSLNDENARFETPGFRRQWPGGGPDPLQPSSGISGWGYGGFGY